MVKHIENDLYYDCDKPYFKVIIDYKLLDLVEINHLARINSNKLPVYFYHIFRLNFLVFLLS